ncbi:MAG: TlpA disulfide reductase family protein [Phycisphaerae bacterium]|nr:TlpA disulfide reductase family protein [Phycisphaerae bacterium]
MTTRITSRLRRLGILVASALGLLAWAAAAAAGPNAIDAPPKPDSGEPRGKQPAPIDEGAALILPEKWDNPALLAQAAIELNSRLAQAERTRLVPWDMAEQIRKSLSAGRAVAGKIDAETRVAYYQALFMAAIAAGHPDEAKMCAQDLLKLDNAQPWNWLSLFRAGMATGDKAACTEAVNKLTQMVGPDKAAAIEPMKEQAGPIGITPACELALSDGTTWTPANSKGRVVVVDFWAQWIRTSQQAMPLTRRAWQTFKDYPAFEMIGVNLDARESRPIVTSYMKANGVDWPAYFEGKTGDRPISFKVFMVKPIPTEVVISPDGKIIFSGVPNDPMFYYAIRAGLVKANGGTIPASQPDVVLTVARPKTGTTGKTVTPPVTPPKTPAPPVGEPKSAEEKAAGQRLRIAEAFLAAGARENAVDVYKEVVAKWPNTDAGFKARAKLLTLVKHSGDIPGVDVP